ncbi:MAG: iron complex outermembrane receptor protein [Cryomorphaceae bacterium]|jgi:iron complex outermembrane receptor protein
MHKYQKDKIQRSLVLTPVAAALLLLSPGLMAQEGPVLEEIVVTAQKRSQNLQDVPISIESFGTQKIREQNIQSFQDYAKLLPSVAFTPTLGGGASFTKVYMRGVATAGDGQATTSQPSVGTYLDEQPITTIQGNLDVHMYDIARVEALAGPQGTLYGASSQAGTLRIITNKPDPSQFDASMSIEGNIVDGDDTGYVAEGFVNMPLSDTMAIRVVGWAKKDAGWIDNVLGSRTFPGVAASTADDITVNNAQFAEDNYNTVDTIGARAALKIDLNDDWTITPTIMAQSQEGTGSWGDDLSDFAPGDQAVTHFQEEFTDDKWAQVGLTIEGKVGNFDLVYSGSYLERDVDGSFDYSDYSYWYDTIYTTGYYADLHFNPTGVRAVANQFFEDAGTRLWPGARFTNNDSYEKYSHELRLSSPQENRLRGMVGFFTSKQTHDFEQRWMVAGLADSMELNAGEPGSQRFPDTVYLNSLDREDTDEAIFGQLSYDITEQLEATVGLRFFKPEVTVNGFFGFGLGFAGIWSGNGEARCSSQADVTDKPCINVVKGIDESDNIGRVNLTYKLDDDRMVYFTWSEGYRPGGINRSPAADEYVSDFLTNVEFGWKTQMMDNRLQFNGALFFQTWDDFQVSFTGANAITQVANGPSADINGIESQFVYAASDNLRISGSFTLIDTELQDDYCPSCNSDGSAWAPAGSSLPVTAEVKGNLVARYTFDWKDWEAHLQGTMVYEGDRGSDLNAADNIIRGDVPSSTVVDLSAGIRNDDIAWDLFIKNATDEDAPQYLTSQCATGTCGTQNYGVRHRPLTVGLRFTKDF